MADWNTRLEVKLGDATVTPISTFTPTFNVPHTVLHSIEAVREGGFDAIVLRSATDLLPAHALYASMGFERYAEQDHRLNPETFQLAFIYRARGAVGDAGAASAALGVSSLGASA